MPRMTTKSFLVLTASALAVSVALLLTPVAVEAFDGTVRQGVDAARVTDVPGTVMGDGGALTTIVNTMLFIIGFLSVIMLIFGGLRYIISGGNAAAVTTAKNTILYAIVGLIIAIFAYAIVNFVIGSLTGGAGGGTNV